MSAIPPPGHASLIQTTGAAQRAGEQRRGEAAADAAKADAFADKLKMAVENDDRDSAVYEDAEGAGGQGRQSSQQHEDHQPPHPAASPDEDALPGHVDVSA